jgi:DNA adenine methylase
MKKISLIRYPGGKFYLLDKILELIRYDVDIYVEPFGGSLKVLLNKKPHKLEIVNDIDNKVINLFEVIRDNLEEFLEKLDGYIYHEEEFKNIIKRQKEDNYKDKITRAVETYLSFQLSFIGLKSAYGVSYSKKNLNQKEVFNRDFKVIKERLRKVVFYSRDYKYILESLIKRKNMKTMVYLDPPYIDFKGLYDFEFKDKNEFYVLKEYLDNLYDYHYILLSLNAHPLTYELFPKDKWNYVEVENIAYGYYDFNKPNNKRKKYKELLIKNY